MRKLSAFVVIAAVLCTGTAYAGWDWDVTSEVNQVLGMSTPSDSSDDWWHYEYIWEVVANPDTNTPSNAWIEIGSCPQVLFNPTIYTIDNAEPDDSDYSSWNWDNTDPGTPGWWQAAPHNGAASYTGGFFVWDPGTIGNMPNDALTSGQRAAEWYNFTTVGNFDKDGDGTLEAEETGAGFYTSFLANRPSRTVTWRIDQGCMDMGTTEGPTPEPVSAALLLLGLPAAVAMRRRRED